MMGGHLDNAHKQSSQARKNKSNNLWNGVASIGYNE